MPRRNLIPLALLGVLALLTLVFALIGASSAPTGATLTVQNATGKTFAGSSSFAMDLVVGTGTGGASQVRLINYTPPNRMAVYQVGSRLRLLAVLDQAASTCALSEYTAIVGGSTPWTQSGKTYTRNESLADFSARVPNVTATSCAPHPATVHGQVFERAAVRSGYVVGLRLTAVIPPQTLRGGGSAQHGTAGETLVLLSINGTRVNKLGS